MGRTEEAWGISSISISGGSGVWSIRAASGSTEGG